MTTTHVRTYSVQNTHTLVGVAWAVVLLISALPNIVVREVLHAHAPWLFWVQAGVLAVGMLLSWIVRQLRPLRVFFGVFLALALAEWGVAQLAPWFQNLLATANSGFIRPLAAQEIQRMLVAFIMIAVCGLLMRQPRAFYLVRGQLDAPAAPIKLVGMTRPSTWNRLGPIMALCLAGGLLVFILVAGGAPLSNLPRVLPLLPFVVVFALVNSFGEEMNYRAPQLGALVPAVGGPQALLMTGVYFGLGHFYGVPYGIVGVVMASVLGWLLGRSMLETKGMFWAWLIHFVMDVVIFTFMAAGSVTPGGR